MTVSSSETIDLDNVPLNGGFLRELVTFGVEAHLRAQMSAGYTIPIPIGGPMTTHAVARVVRSEHPKFKVGDHIKALFTDVVKYQVVEPSAADSWQVLQNPHNLPWHRFLGIAGMSGRTAYYGYRLLTGPNSHHPAKKGETIYISTAAGPIGSLLVQHFKRLGLKVIGSTGSQDKVRYLKEELGCDVAFSYKDETVDSVLKREGPIDIYWDNVGGDSLEAAVANMNKFGRIVSCGFTSTYGTGKAAPFLSMLDVMFKSITIQGLYWDNFAYLYEKDFDSEFLPMIATGEFKFPEHVVQGFENVEQALVDVLRGSSFGKTVVVV